MRLRRRLMLTLLAGIVALPTVLAGSPASRPDPIVPGDRCHRCDRLLSDPFIGAEVLLSDGKTVSKFRTVRCMLTHLADTPADVGEMLVVDDQTGALVSVDKAVFVPVSIDRHTGEESYGIGDTDYVGFKSRKVAERFAARHGVTTMSWPAVVYYAASLPVSLPNAD